MDLWTRYFYERHSEAELRQWAKRLSLFRYFRAYGGHANDGDSLDCAFSYSSIADLERFFSEVGIAPERFDLKPPQPEPGIAYPVDVYVTFPSLISNTHWIRQPGYCEIGGNRAFVWCEAGKIKISVGSGSYDVTESDVLNAEALEKSLRRISLEVIDPPSDTNHYVCPKYYPEFFA